RRILWVNQDFERITGYRLNEVVGQSPGAILQGPQTEPDAIKRIRSGLDSGHSFKDVITNYRKNGDPYICKLVIHPIYNSLKELVNFLAFEVDGNQVTDEEDVPLMRIDNRYRTSSLRGIEEVQLYERIREIIIEEKVYLDPYLSLRKLAVMVDTNTKYLSQVINHFTGDNFLSFVNSFRVEAVKKRIAMGEHRELTFFGVAQQCGFKNKSTFYKVFRDHTSQTPNGYAKALLQKQ
ncbi:MAG: PAS domain-containing protein, partial [Bacteroidota bacterium]